MPAFNYDLFVPKGGRQTNLFWLQIVGIFFIPAAIRTGFRKKWNY